MFLGWPSTEIAKIVPLRWIKWPTKLKIEKKQTFKRHLLLGKWPDFKIISQKCILGDPLPKLLKWLRSTEQNGRHSKKQNKKKTKKKKQTTAPLNKMAAKAKNRKKKKHP